MLTILKEHSRCRRGESTQELASLQERDAGIGGKRAGKSFLKILRKHDERKNCAILKARVLVKVFLTHPVQIKWIRIIPVLDVNLNLRPSN